MKEEFKSIKERLLSSPTGEQWRNIKVCNHHGIALPLFSLHSKSSCGIGEYPDLIPIIDWCHDVGFDVIQLLPLNDTGLESSPYSALSANALNPIHIGLSHLPLLEKHPDLQAILQELQSLANQTQRINYKVLHLKREEFLRRYYTLCAPLTVVLDKYQTFKKNQSGWLHDYAIFKALKILQQWKNWEDWPPELQKSSLSFFEQLPQELEAEAEYHRLLQFLCFEQFQEVKLHAEKLGVYLKGDIPILINRESVDVWRYPEQFEMALTAGAPPDIYSNEGQKWGFPLYKWDVVAAGNYRWWIQRLEIASHFYHLYRIDHIVGFFRIWAIPLDLPPRLGHFIPVDEKKWVPQGEEIMRIMLAHCTMLPIGEDLGVVPPEVRECLRTLGICGTKVMRWERYWHGDQSFIDPKDYPPESMTTVSTHDSETLQLWWRDQTEEAKTYAESQGWEYSPELTADQRFTILRASHQSGSFFHINLLQEYLALVPEMTWPNPEDERINIPGTISDKNWSYRFLPSVEEIANNSELRICLKQTIQKMIR